MTSFCLLEKVHTGPQASAGASATPGAWTVWAWRGTASPRSGGALGFWAAEWCSRSSAFLGGRRCATPVLSPRHDQTHPHTAPPSSLHPTRVPGTASTPRPAFPQTSLSTLSPIATFHTTPHPTLVVLVLGGSSSSRGRYLDPYYARPHPPTPMGVYSPQKVSHASREPRPDPLSGYRPTNLLSSEPNPLCGLIHPILSLCLYQPRPCICPWIDKTHSLLTPPPFDSLTPPILPAARVAHYGQVTPKPQQQELDKQPRLNKHDLVQERRLLRSPQHLSFRAVVKFSEPPHQGGKNTDESLPAVAPRR